MISLQTANFMRLFNIAQNLKKATFVSRLKKEFDRNAPEDSRRPKASAIRCGGRGVDPRACQFLA
jgi:hypothetical protein